MRISFKMSLKSLLFCCLLISMNSFAAGITLPELREIVSSDPEVISRGKIVAEINLFDNSYVSSSPQKNNREDDELKIKRINSQQKYLSTYTFDMTRSLTKEVWEDLRDLDAIAKKENLTPVQRSNVDCSQAVLVDNTTLNEISFLDGNRTGAEPQACLNKRPGKIRYYVEPGTINKKYLKEEYSTKLTQLTEGDSDLLKIEITFDENGDSKLEYICDPGLGYRFKEQNWIYKGQVTKKITAEDYKITDGIPYPFTYTTTYYRNGEVKKRITKKVKEAKLNSVLTKKDFKIFLPKGTFMIEDVILHSTRTIEYGGAMGISDVLGLYAEEVASEELLSLTARDDVSENNSAISRNKSTVNQTESLEIILPKMQLAKPKGKPFVLDLASRKIIMAGFKGGLNSETAYKYFIKHKKGDILWSGKMVTIRGAEIISINPDKLKMQKKEWVGLCEMSLGCSFTVKTKEKKLYEIVVSEIDEDKIKLRINNKIN